MRRLIWLILLAGALLRSSSPAEIMYTAQELGQNYQATALNLHGEIAGDHLGTIPRGAISDGTNWVRTGLSGEHISWSSLSDINDGHWAVGFNTLHPETDPSTSISAIRININAPFDIYPLGTLTGEKGQAKARGINNLNVAVGDSLNAAGKLRAVRFETNGTVTDLGTLGGDSSSAVAINDQGVIAGDSMNPAGMNRGFILDASGIMRDLGTLGGDETFVTGINNRGEIIGQSFVSSGELHAFVFANGQIQNLGTLPGGKGSIAFGINDHGVIVGAATKENGALVPFIKYPGQPMQDLSLMVHAPYPDIIASARAINNRGAILARGRVNGVNYLLRPGALTITRVGNVARVRYAAPIETTVLIERSSNLKIWTPTASIGAVREPFSTDFVLGNAPMSFRGTVTIAD
ncbi:MAG TPA: hypothetical protein VF773_14715 [Verrucomicrobiae bacterium]